MTNETIWKKQLELNLKNICQSGRGRWIICTLSEFYHSRRKIRCIVVSRTEMAAWRRKRTRRWLCFRWWTYCWSLELFLGKKSKCIFYTDAWFIKFSTLWLTFVILFILVGHVISKIECFNKSIEVVVLFSTGKELLIWWPSEKIVASTWSFSPPRFPKLFTTIRLKTKWILSYAWPNWRYSQHK